MPSDITGLTTDIKLFDECFRRYYQPLCYFAFNILKDNDPAEDVVQNVFLNLLKEQRRFQDEVHLKHFLYLSVRNACFNELKRNSLHTEILDAIEPENTEAEEDAYFFQNVVRAEVYNEIMKAIESLPTECSKIFRMAYVNNYDNQEIAERLSISVNTVKVQKNRAKKRLRLLLKDLYPLVYVILKISAL
jgi:RNA polymerase sigma factor, sigma-70 family/RNA polymerase sigma-70 factor, Bacteroides expansion family 1